MKKDALPVSKVDQLTNRLDTGQQDTSTAATKTPSLHHLRVADQRSSLTDQSQRPGIILSKTDVPRVKLGLTGSEQVQQEVTYSSQEEDWNETNAAGDFSNGISSPSATPPATCTPETKSRTLTGTTLNIYRRYATPLLAASISITSFISPIVMVSLPLASGYPDLLQGPSDAACDPDCEGLLISLSFKLLILLIGTWALFARRPQASLPRLPVLRSLVLFAAALLTLSYWLFYAVRILRPGVNDYRIIVGFASSLVDTLLFVHYLAVILLRIRPVIGGQFVVKIVRSPDGASRSYSVGPMSIQSLAVRCLQHYYRDFPVYNPHLDRIRGGPETQRSPSGPPAEYKLYSVDDTPSPLGPASPDAAAGADATEARSPAAGPSTSGSGSGSGCLARRRRDSEEQRRDWQRRMERRRSKLICATEEAFSRVAKMDGAGEITEVRRYGGWVYYRLGSMLGAVASISPLKHLALFIFSPLPGRPSSVYLLTHIAVGKPEVCVSVEEASEVVFGFLSRPLHRYLRLVRQHPPYSKQTVLDHLSICITHEMSATSFLERYLQQTPVGLAPDGAGGLDGEEDGENQWTIVSDKLLNAAAENSTTFEMRRERVRLLVTVREIPYLCLTQDSSDLKTKRFVVSPSGQATRERTL